MLQVILRCDLLYNVIGFETEVARERECAERERQVESMSVQRRAHNAYV